MLNSKTRAALEKLDEAQGCHVVWNDAEHPFVVRLVPPGDYYGLNFQLRNSSERFLIEFYDARYPHTVFGQFVSRYHFCTLQDRFQPGVGLNLDGGVEEWSLSAIAYEDAMQWATIAKESLAVRSPPDDHVVCAPVHRRAHEGLLRGSRSECTAYRARHYAQYKGALIVVPASCCSEETLANLVATYPTTASPDAVEQAASPGL